MRLPSWAFLTVALVGWCLNPAEMLAEGRSLDALRNEVDEPAAPRALDESHGHSEPRSGRNGRSSSLGWGADDDGDVDSTEQALGWVFLMGATAPWWGPYVVLEGDSAGVAAFPVGPYSQGYDGYLVFDEETLGTRPWSGRVSFDTADNFDDLTTLTGRLRLDSRHRFGLDAEWSSLVERQSGGTDWLGRGDCNLVVRFAQSPHVQFHSGIGVNWLADRNHADMGFNFTYGVDLFPVDPVVASATIDLGTIGDSSLLHVRSTVGLMIRPRLHVYTGYDLLNLEGHSIHSLLTGIEFWF